MELESAEYVEPDMTDIAADFINSTAAHIFLTGKAGTGKTTFLRGLAERTHKSFAVVAPTGIAALNAGGVTIHSQFLLPLGMFIPDRAYPATAGTGENFYTHDTLTRKHPLNSARKQVLRSIDLLVIDEVSMLRADLLDAIDARLKAARGNYTRPFGGVQLLLIGDLYQLPPVVKASEAGFMQQYYASSWFYESKALRQAGIVYIELSKIFRQHDAEFIHLLNNLRCNTPTSDDISLLNKHVKRDEERASLREVITLTTHNYKADSMNREELARLDTPSHFFEATIEGEFPENIYPVQANLELKEGAQIMFVRNDSEGRAYFNGKLATVERIHAGTVEVVMADSHEPYELKKERWENKRYNVADDTRDLSEEVIGSFEQYPVKLAWAITVHKSQGLTFDKAIIDISQAFADGQVYVALSRLRSLDGLILSKPVNPSVISTDRSVVAFSKQNNRPGELPEVMKRNQLAFIGQIIDKTFDFEELVRQMRYIGKTMTDTAVKTAEESQETALDNLVSSLLAENENTRRYRNQLHGLLGNAKVGELLDRVQKGSAYYADLLWKNIEALLRHVREMQGHKRIKSYLNSLEELDQLFMKKLREVAKIPALAEAILGDKHQYQFDELTFGLQEKRQSILNALPEIQAGTKSADRPRKRKKKKDAQLSTVDITLAMFFAGQNVGSIAVERGLTTGTIEGHLARAVMEGRIDILKVMSEDELKEIMETAGTMAEGFGHKELYSQLKGKYSYGKLRAAMHHYRVLVANQ